MAIVTEGRGGRSRRGPWLAGGVAVIAIGAAAWWIGMRGGPSPPVVVPALSAGAEAGRTAFARGCAACHGAHAEGTASGPPLIHPIYRPNDHADEAFLLAVRRGVRAHHWRFGDMAAQPQVDAEEIRRIVLYVRELQRANGIN